MTLAGKWRTRTLKDGLTALGQSGARSRWGSTRRTRRCGVDRTRSGLRHNQSTLRHDGLAGNGQRRLRSSRSRGRGISTWLCRLRSCWCLDHGSFAPRLGSDGCGVHRHSSGRLDHGRNGFGLLLRHRDSHCGRCRRSLGRHRNGRRRTRNGLRSNEARRGLGRLNRSYGRGAGYRCRGLGRNAGRTRGHRRRRSHTCARRSRWSSSNGPWRSGWLGSLLGNRLEHIAGLGNVRQINLGLELVGGRTRGATGKGTSGLTVLGVILPDALRFVHFNGAGVRLLLCDSDLNQ